MASDIELQAQTYRVDAEIDGGKAQWSFDQHETAVRFWESVAATRQVPGSTDVVEKATTTRSDGKIMHRAEGQPVRRAVRAMTTAQILMDAYQKAKAAYEAVKRGSSSRRAETFAALAETERLLMRTFGWAGPDVLRLQERNYR